MRPGRAVITLAVAAVLVASSARRRRRRGTPQLVAGEFINGMGYVRLGTGARTLLWIPDPSHSGDLTRDAPAGTEPPRSGYLKVMATALRPFAEDGYSVFLVGHKPDLPRGCSVADLAEDYARVMVEEFGGKVDLVVADSGGGAIGFSLAAAHPDRFGHIAFVAAAHTMPEEARAADLTSARLLSAGRKTEAAEAMVTYLNPGLPAWLRRLMASVVARVSFPAEYNPGDVLIAAEALGAFDGRQVLPTVTVPVLLICGDRDRFVPQAIYQQTADLLPDCTLTFYEHKGHLGTLTDKRLPHDVLGFARPQLHAQPRDGAEVVV